MKHYMVYLTYKATLNYGVEADSREEAVQKAYTRASSSDCDYGSFDCDLENDIEEMLEPEEYVFSSGRSA
jgi:hypothetical protein